MNSETAPEHSDKARIHSARRWLLAKMLRVDPQWAGRQGQGEEFAEAVLRGVYRIFSSDVPRHVEMFETFCLLTPEEQKDLIQGFQSMGSSFAEIFATLARASRIPGWSQSLKFGNGDSFSQEGEDLLLREEFRGQDSGFYIDVGAHHPYRFSNTAYFALRGWKGINIDPTPGTVSLFSESRPRDLTLECGIGEKDGELDFWVFDEPALNTMDRERAAMLERESRYRVKEVIKIPIRRLDSILSEHLPSGQTIDFMSIDVEGLELSVLKSNDWSRFRPRVVLLEVLNASFAEIRSHPKVQLMSEYGYEPFIKNTRTIFFKDSSR